MSKASIPSTPSATDYDKHGPRDLSWIEAEDPIALFELWLAKAGETEPNDSNAMSLATVDGDGLPDVRMILLKGYDARGFVFYTNEDSAKGEQLKEQGKAALGFHWKSVRRQVRIRGAVERVSEAESDAYFASRARGSRIGAWASDQSRPVEDREVLMARTQEIELRVKMSRALKTGMAGGSSRKPSSFGRMALFGCMTVLSLHRAQMAGPRRGFSRERFRGIALLWKPYRYLYFL